MNIEKILKELTLEEKASLCSGSSFWNTQPIERLEIPAVMMSDGPHGLRKQDGTGDHLGMFDSIKAVCFPSNCALASSFDQELAEKIGETIGKECQAEDLAMILGPAVNIKRSPLCGRNFEYYSEDSYLAGKMGAAFVKGVQSQGVSACVKHYAANNQETMRMSGESVVDERTLHEIYLAPFETIVKDASPNSIMCAYNQVNGVFCSENRYLNTEVLREKWGFSGFVVTDWGASKDAAKGVHAGVDLVMPGGGDTVKDHIVEAVQKGELTEEELNNTVRNILNFVDKSIENHRSGIIFDREADYKIAAEAAKECAVLLKNENNILPLNKKTKVAFIGEFAKKPRYQGGGSSHINSAKVVNACDAAIGMPITYAQGYRKKDAEIDEKLMAAAVETAREAEVAVLFVGLPEIFETEGADRTTLDMPANQNALIEAVCDVQPNTIIVLHNGSPVTMPWIDRVSAVLELYLAGDGVGEAAVSLLYGETNPSGKLAETFLEKLSDASSFLNFPGERGRVEYREGVFVGYRYYDKKETSVLFPFGYGLSYTQFEYSALKLDKNELQDTDKLTVTCTVKNTGKRAGKEVVQVYVRDINSSVMRPIRELKAFAKIALEAGESKQVKFELDKRAFAYYETRLNDFYVETGEFAIEIGASSRDIRLMETVFVNSTVKIPITFNRNSTLGEIMSTEKGKMVLNEMMSRIKTVDIGSAAEKNGLGEASGEIVMKMMQDMTISGALGFTNAGEDVLDNILNMLNN